MSGKDNLMYLLVALVWMLNFSISFWNAYATGKSWPYAKQMGGWPRFMTFMGWLMSACGFSWCLLIPLALLAYVNELYGFNAYALQTCLNMGYVILAPIICFAGLFIWIDSLIEAWRRRTVASFAVAGWNTYAQVSNVIDVFTNVGPAFEQVADFFKSGGKSSTDDDDKDGSAIVIVIVLVAVALIGGFLLATAIVAIVARKEARSFAIAMDQKRQVEA